MIVKILYMLILYLSKEIEMIAIRVRYCPATNHRGPRLVVTDGRHRHRLSVPYEYGNDDHEKLNAAIQFKLKYLPHTPELNPTPSQFNGDCYFSFYPKSDPEKLEELLSQFDGVKLTPFAADLIRTFVMQNCILK